MQDNRAFEARKEDIPRNMRISFANLIAASLLVGLIGACSSRDLADMGNTWPDLSDIAAAPEAAPADQDHEAVIRALREEAEARKTEGYQAPAPIDPDRASDTDSD